MRAAARASKRRRTTIATDILAEYVQDLPAELFNNIFEYVLETETPKAVVIDELYRPPRQLQVNSGSRQEIAAKYYSNIIFIMTEETRDIFQHWFQSLALSHFEQTARVHAYKPPSKSLGTAGNNSDCATVLRLGRAVLRQVQLWFRMYKGADWDMKLPKLSASDCLPG